MSKERLILMESSQAMTLCPPEEKGGNTENR